MQQKGDTKSSQGDAILAFGSGWRPTSRLENDLTAAAKPAGALGRDYLTLTIALDLV
jgi:hypothetical protein